MSRRPFLALAAGALAAALVPGLTALPAAATAAVTPGAAAPAMALPTVSGGQADGNGHPAVALIGSYVDGARFRCTATLVSPTVLLTAGHCTFGTTGKVAITFSPTVVEGTPSSLPAAADPAAGYSADELAAYGWASGTAYTHPGFDPAAAGPSTTDDVGIVMLDQPVTDREPTDLAAAGLLDRPAATPRTVDALGYVTDAPAANAATPSYAALVRRVTQVPVAGVSGRVLSTGGAGRPCFGDSGGPVLIDGTIVGVVSYGNPGGCGRPDDQQRLDVPVVRSWLEQFGLTFG